MTDPIEAACAAVNEGWADRPENGFQGKAIRRALMKRAIAAFLDAVREPSEGMKHSGTEFLYGEDFIGNPKAVTTAVETWRAMIDALRAELLPPPGDA